MFKVDPDKKLKYPPFVPKKKEDFPNDPYFEFRNQVDFDFVDKDHVHQTRISNNIFNQLLMSEFCVTFFSIFGLLISVILYELQI